MNLFAPEDLDQLESASIRADQKRLGSGPEPDHAPSRDTQASNAGTKSLGPQSLGPQSLEAKSLAAREPLAARMRPRTLDEFVGQRHLAGPNAPLRRAAQSGRLPSSVFHGPAGTGKTTLARLLAQGTRAHFEDFSAITGGVADVRRIVERARQNRRRADDARTDDESGVTVLFVDEIHRFNRAQQDAFLPAVEEGVLTLLGATTENPLAALNTPLLSRCRLWRFEPLEPCDLRALLERAILDPRGLDGSLEGAQDEALDWLVRASRGDARAALGALELSADLARARGVRVLSPALAREAASSAPIGSYDPRGDEHYDCISAYIKSVRGGDPDAALFWMARMLEGGEDPMFVARRLVIAASEDVGNADPQALVVAMAALGAVEKIGLPEAAIPLAQATTYCACAPKSNAAYLGLGRAREAVKTWDQVRVPPHLRSSALQRARPGAPSASAPAGEGYLCPHDFPDHFVPQDYLPPDSGRTRFYEPTQMGHEARLAARLQSWWGDGK